MKLSYLRWWGPVLKEKRPYLARAIRSLLTPVRLAFRIFKAGYNRWAASPPDGGITPTGASRRELNWGSSSRFRPRRPIL